MKEGVQSVTMNILRNTSSFPNFANGTFVNISSDMVNFWMQLASISYATQALFLGNITSGIDDGTVTDNTLAGQPSLLRLPVESVGVGLQFAWGDVLGGIEELSRNVTAALLTLQLGNKTTECFFYPPDVVYQYSSFELWAPYAVSNFSLLSCYDLTFSPLCFIDNLGHCSYITLCCHRDNGKKSHWRYYNIIFKYGYFNENYGRRFFSRNKVEAESNRGW